MIQRVCVIGAGSIGSLFAGHLAQVVDVSVLTRRQEHADTLNRDGLRVTGRSDLHAAVQAAADPDALAPFDLGIVATKAGGLEDAAAALEGRFPEALVMTTLNGLGAEEVVRAHGDWPIVSAVTFMSGTKHSDSEVEYVLDTATWMGPYEDTPLERVEEVGDLVRRSGLEAEVFADLRPAQWSKLIFNATVNSVAALTGLRHDHHFADEAGARRPRSPRPRPRRRGEGSRRRGGHRALRGPLGDERPCDAAGLRSLSVDAGGRRIT